MAEPGFEPGQLWEKRKRNLCAMLSPQIMFLMEGRLTKAEWSNNPGIKSGILVVPG